MIILGGDNKNKKIGIITLIGYDNYGNRLQNYATQEIIKNLGYDTETLIINSISNSSTLIEKTKRKIDTLSNMSLNKIGINLFKKVKRKSYFYINKTIIKKRQKAFINFVNEYITELTFGIKNNLSILNNYEYFIVGSDQVWNPSYNNGYGLSIYFLDFAPKHKRIAYAASFGISSIPEDYKGRYKKWLSEMHRLSAREEAGAKIIKELTGRSVAVLVDPTLMLSKDKWLSISKEDIYKPDNQFLLTYFLGKVTKETRKRIKQIARENNLQIVMLADIRDKKRYIAGPSEFIDYINSATLVCTDSFHGSVFSILMETPFIVFDRVGALMYSRIETLLNKFNLNSRQADNIKTKEQIFNCDFSHIPPILEKEREKALDYLKEALNIN